MPQSLAQVYIHLIFSTKQRAPILPTALCADFSAYFGGTLNNMDSPLVAFGMAKDHVHLLFRQSKGAALVDLVQGVKTGTSKWLKTKLPQLADFHWQAGYGAFSVSASRLEAVTQYVLGQEGHHRKVTFQEEFRSFLLKYKIEYDEKHVWD